MPYTAADGVQVPAGTDAFSPPTQFKTWADKAATYHNRVIVTALTDRDALTGMSEGWRCYVTADNSEWVYNGSTWIAAYLLADTGWITPTLLNSWVNFGAPYRTCQYRRLNGVVYVSGLLKSGTTTANTVLFNLPAGFRPSANLFFGTQSNSAMATVQLAGNGDLSLSAGVSALSLTLMFAFIAEQ